ncbi:MAG: hypothetical protein K0S93_1278 [Nitrososphaeraceae archaeon]|nr:hypothetical protein [Nitrososphaeraceae archaeon]
MQKKRDCPICSNCGTKKFKIIEKSKDEKFIKIQCIICLKISLI